MGSAASLALGETCTEKNDARSDRALLVPMRSQEASAVCVRDHESRLAPGLKTKPRLSVFLFLSYSLGGFTKRVPDRLQRYNNIIQSNHGRNGEYGIIITLRRTSPRLRFNKAVRAWRRNVMYKSRPARESDRSRVAHRS
jgi:hypothetical protein